jgi:hypothetical protein
MVGLYYVNWFIMLLIPFTSSGTIVHITMTSLSLAVILHVNRTNEVVFLFVG